MFAIDLETATRPFQRSLQEGVSGCRDAVVQKCVTFFLYAANDAGVRISGRVLKGREAAVSDAARRLAKPSFAHPPIKEFEAAPPQPQPLPSPHIDGKTPSEILRRTSTPTRWMVNSKPAVWTLLKYFKAKGL